MRCIHCGRQNPERSEDLREPLTPEQYINKLKAQKNDLEGAASYLKDAREKLMHNNPRSEGYDSAGFDLLIAIEQLCEYLKRDLNMQLLSEGQQPYRKKR